VGGQDVIAIVGQTVKAGKPSTEIGAGCLQTGQCSLSGGKTGTGNRMIRPPPLIARRCPNAPFVAMELRRRFGNVLGSETVGHERGAFTALRLAGLAV